MNAWSTMNKGQQRQIADRLIRLNITDDEFDSLDLSTDIGLVEQVLRQRGEL